MGVQGLSLPRFPGLGMFFMGQARLEKTVSVYREEVVAVSLNIWMRKSLSLEFSRRGFVEEVQPRDCDNIFLMGSSTAFSSPVRRLVNFSKLTFVDLSTLCLKDEKDACIDGYGYTRCGWMESVDSMTSYGSSVEIHLFFSQIEDGYFIRTPLIGFENQAGYACKVFDTCLDSKSELLDESQALDTIAEVMSLVFRKLCSTGRSVHRWVARHSLDDNLPYRGFVSFVLEIGLEDAILEPVKGKVLSNGIGVATELSTAGYLGFWVIQNLDPFVDKCNMKGVDLQCACHSRYQVCHEGFILMAMCNTKRVDNNGMMAKHNFDYNRAGQCNVVVKRPDGHWNLARAREACARVKQSRLFAWKYGTEYNAIAWNGLNWKLRWVIFRVGRTDGASENEVCCELYGGCVDLLCNMPTNAGKHATTSVDPTELDIYSRIDMKGNVGSVGKHLLVIRCTCVGPVLVSNQGC